MKTILYLGIDPPLSKNSKFSYDPNKSILIHYPIIKTISSDTVEIVKAFDNFLNFSHIIFTSKTSVKIFFETLNKLSFSHEEINQKHYIAVGKSTAQILAEHEISTPLIAEDETAEGIILLLKTLSLTNSSIFFPHSKLSRKTLVNFFLEENIEFQESIFYDTVAQQPGPLPCLSLIDEIVFTSPSTVDAFLSLFKRLPQNKILTPIGPQTKLKLEKSFD